MVVFPGARKWRTYAQPWMLAPPMPPYGHFIELELAGPGNGWTYVSRDVLAAAPIRMSYGPQGTGPLDLVAPMGSLSFSLDNSEANSAGLIGYYTQGGAFCRPGFKRGIGVRYRYRVPETHDIYLKFSGRLLAADPTAGEWGDRRTACLAGDWMGEAAEAKVSLPTQINKRADELVALVIGAMDRHPSGTVLEVGLSTFPYSFDNSRPEGATALTLIQQACLSEFARCYLRGGLGLPGMELVLENRATRLTPLPVAAFEGTQQGLKSGSVQRNRALVTMRPRRVDPTYPTVLFAKPATSNPAVAPGQTITLTFRYNDPANGASRVGGTDMVPLAATTDYLMNAAADGSGADVTGVATVVGQLDSSQAIVRVTNTSGTQFFITKMQGRGRLLADYDPLTADREDAASIVEVGENPISLTMPFQSDFAVADAVAEFLVATWATPGATEVKLTFIPTDQDELILAMSLEPGDPISVSETVTATNGVFYIQNVDISIDGDKAVFTWSAQRALVADYWTLGVAGFSELGINTVLAPL